MRRLAGTLGPTLVAVLFASVLALVAGRGDGFRFFLPIHAGADFAHPGVLLPGQPLEKESGYDGQFTFYIAEDPLLLRPATGASLDSSYRYRRILLPLLGWLLSLGRRELIPLALVVLNLAAVVALTACAAAAAARAGRSPWAALALTFYAGCWIPVLWDLTDTVSSALIAAGLLLDSAGLLLLATLARETAGVVLALRALAALVRRDWERAGPALAATAVFASWALAVWIRLPDRVANPLNFVDRRQDLVYALTHDDAGSLGVLAPVLLLCALALVRPLLGPRDDVSIAAAISAAAVLVAGQGIWLDGLDFYRYTLPVAVLVFFSWCRSGDRLGAAAVIVTLIIAITSLAGAALVLAY